MVLARGRNNGVWGRADDGASALAAISCSLVRVIGNGILVREYLAEYRDSLK